MTAGEDGGRARRSAAQRAIWARLAVRWASSIHQGRLTLVFPDGSSRAFQGSEPGPEATLVIHRGRMVWRMLSGGDVGLAESYMEGDWTSPDLTALLRLGYANEASLPLSASPVLRPFIRLWHRLHANTRAGSRRNIARHYDLGNEFFAAWLDPSMTYSSALFAGEGLTLEEAQRQKYQRAIDHLGLAADDRLLEIGSGWGGFAELAASETGCQVTGLTLSREQAAFARERIAGKQLSHLVDFRLEDYRDVKGVFDKIVSIEMFEAVGEENWSTYFRTMRDRLRAGGRAVVQVITIADSRFEAYRRKVDFIQRYIFPGGMLPSPATLARDIGAAGLKLRESFSFGLSYAETLRQWNERFQARWEDIARLGFDERFRRMWTYYLHATEAAFRSGSTDVSQLVIDRA